MQNQLRFDRIYSVSLSLTIVAMLLLPKLISVAMVLLFLTVIMGIFSKRLTFKGDPVSFMFIGLYLLYVLGMLYSEDTAQGGKYLEYKLSFLIFPFLLMWRTEGTVYYDWLAKSFIGSLIALFVLGLFNGLENMGEMSFFNSFTSTRFSYVHHPTYLSVFALFGIELIRTGFMDLRNKSWLKVLLIFFLVVVQLLCMSLAGLLFLFGYAGIMVLIAVKKRFGTKWVVGISGLSLALLVGLSAAVPQVKLQFKSAYDSVLLFAEDPKQFVRTRQTYVTGNETRLIMWTATFYEIKDHPFGVGTGSVDIHLEERLRKLKQPQVFIDHHYNPHNQFLQTWLEVGLVGFLTLLMIIATAIYVGFRTKNSLLVLLGFSLLFQNLFESMFQRQSGIVFYTFWLCFLAVYGTLYRRLKPND